MKLILQNGYPYPYPADATEDQQEALTEAASDNTVVLDNVVAFQWLHTVTIEFSTYEDTRAAHELLGWPYWGPVGRVLEAKTSVGDGYGHPAIIAGNMAYCGFNLIVE